MAVRITYHCPHCQSDINGQTWLPPVTKLDTCRACGGKVLRSGGSIRDAWSTSFMLLGFVPTWLAFTVSFAVNGAAGKGGLFAAAFLSFIITLVPGALVLSVLGWIVGLFVSIFAPSAPPAPKMTDADVDALRGALFHGHRWKEKWNG